MKSLEKNSAITLKQLIKELEELEPKNIVEYIFKGSALNQWISKRTGKKL